MAATAWLSMTLVDDDQRRTTKVVQMEVQALHATQVSAATAFVAALEDVTDLGVERVDIIYKGVTAGFAAVEDSNVDIGATFAGELYDKNGAKASFKVPGIKSSLKDGVGGIPIDAVPVAALLAFFVNATPFDYLISDGETIDHWLRGTLDK